jgi:hypothetical protein
MRVSDHVLSRPFFICINPVENSCHVFGAFITKLLWAGLDEPQIIPRHPGAHD